MGHRELVPCAVAEASLFAALRVECSQLLEGHLDVDDILAFQLLRLSKWGPGVESIRGRAIPSRAWEHTSNPQDLFFVCAGFASGSSPPLPKHGIACAQQQREYTDKRKPELSATILHVAIV
eukprot:6197091-Pleurochrysis_carterae.AAC.5